MRSFQRYKDHFLVPCGLMGNRSKSWLLTGLYRSGSVLQN
ncbi:unnamed protein product [Arabidopsis halleri]